jgi:hypothetical protein
VQVVFELGEPLRAKISVLNCEPARLSSNDLRSQPMAFSISFPHLIASIVGFGPSSCLVGLSPSLWCRESRV